jgi:hypothetical protein
MIIISAFIFLISTALFLKNKSVALFFFKHHYPMVKKTGFYNRSRSPEQVIKFYRFLTIFFSLMFLLLAVIAFPW